MRAARGLALALVFGTGTAVADLCDGCSFSMDYADGGLVTGSGATIKFGPGGALVLGTGGTLNLGTGGSLTPDVDPPDMSAGGMLVLGDGGSIQFGPGGSLASGDAGDIELTETGGLSFDDASAVAIDGGQSVHLGVIEAADAATLAAGRYLIDLDTTTNIHLHFPGTVNVAADLDITYASASATSLELRDGASDGGFSDCSNGCPSGGTSTIGSPTIPSESNLLGPQTPGAGGPGPLTLAPLALVAILVRRRR